MLKPSIETLKYLLLLSSLPVFGFNNLEITPIRVVAELNIGETREIEISNGETIKLSLLEIMDVRDEIKNAIRDAFVRISVDGEEITINSGNYHLPVGVGKVQIDCPVIKAYLDNSSRDLWHLEKDARFRLWPRNSNYLHPGTFVYPVKQKWFSTKTQAGNVPNFGNDPAVAKIYYHEGFDIGGTEAMNEIVSATDGLVISANGSVLEEYKDLELRRKEATDGVYVLDNRGWYIRYSHLDSIDPKIKPGLQIKMGQRIGFIGKQGSSGGWVHLHFDIKNHDTPSGKIGFEDVYAYAWESYVHQYKPALIAVARPHCLVWTGQEATFDGRKSKSFNANIVSYEWTFSDGTFEEGPVQKKYYQNPGEYCEILKVTDSEGNVDFDMAYVEVIDRDNPSIIPYMHASYYPTFGIKPGDPVNFYVRTFFRKHLLDCVSGVEIWDFGDGSPPVTVRSVFDPEKQTEGEYAKTIHSFSKPGHYLVKVQRQNECGYIVFNYLHVKVEN